MGLLGGCKQSMTERSGGKECDDETLHPDPVFGVRDMAAKHSSLATLHLSGSHFTTGSS